MLCTNTYFKCASSAYVALLIIRIPKTEARITLTSKTISILSEKILDFFTIYHPENILTEILGIINIFFLYYFVGICGNKNKKSRLDFHLLAWYNNAKGEQMFLKTKSTLGNYGNSFLMYLIYGYAKANPNPKYTLAYP